MSADDPQTCLLEVRRKFGNVGVRLEAQRLGTDEWVEVKSIPFPEECTGVLHVEIGHLKRLAPEGMNTRVVFWEMPSE